MIERTGANPQLKYVVGEALKLKSVGVGRVRATRERRRQKAKGTTRSLHTRITKGVVLMEGTLSSESYHSK